MLSTGIFCETEEYFFALVPPLPPLPSDGVNQTRRCKQYFSSYANLSLRKDYLSNILSVDVEKILSFQ